MQFGLFDERPRQFATLDDLVAAMMNMKDDPLFDAGTNMVIHRGNPHAKLMIIGEAPGTEENRQGKPFVGRSGQLLEQILQSANFDPEQDVFITNAVFRLPPGDDGKPLRKPTSDEIAYYKPYLLRNPSREPGSPKALMWEDIREVRRKYDELVGGATQP